MLSRPLFSSISFGALLSCALLIGSQACSGAPQFGTDSGSGGSAGACRIAGVTGCGQSCSSDTGCGHGLFCDTEAGTCDAECVAGVTDSADCGGQPCATNGRCIGDSGSGGVNGAGGSGIDPGPGDGGGDGLGGDGNCIDQEVTPTPIIPNVVLLIDRSLSMTGADGYMALVQGAITAGDYTPMDDCTGPVAGAPGGSGDAEFWRWNVVRTALFNPDDGTVTSLDQSVRFGLTTYSSDATCPELTNVDLALDNRDAMLAGFPCSSLILQTPTRESLAPTADALAALDVDGPKFIVLATDGAPDNCACPDFGGGQAPPCNAAGAQEAEQAAVVAEATRVHDLGITLHVIDVSSPPSGNPDDDTLHQHLVDVATAGGGDIYDGTNPAGLIDAFEKIISDAQSCVIQLDGNIVEGKESTGTVKLDGEEQEYEEDWIVPQSDQIELIDDACEQFKTESPTLTVEFPCGVFVVK